MFIPLHDANELKYIKVQYVTISLIVINVLVWLLMTGVSDDTAQRAAIGFGYIPSTLYDIAERGPSQVIVPDGLTYITYAFLHGDFMHLAGNMLFLWVFGDNVEDALGHFRFLVFYFLCAAAGAWLHGIVDTSSQVPLIGASGAIAGVVAAYLLLHPRVKVWVLVLMRLPLRIPAWIPIALWIAFQFLMFLIAGEDQVSWGAHVGGIIAGALLILIMRRKGVPLFDRQIVTPRAVRVDTTGAGSVPSVRTVEEAAPAAPPKRIVPWGRQ
ncbi:MAG: rhomboid family intramembrane serine protease [Mesorhizobium sp.]